MKFNASYLKILNILLKVLYFVDRNNLFYACQNESIEEGSSYIWKRKTLYLVVKFGLLLVLTILWHLLLIDDSTLAESIVMPIMLVLISLALLIIPIFMSLLDIAIKNQKLKK